MYSPAVPGAVSVTGLPLELVVELKLPPAGLMLQATPMESFVLAVSFSGWPVVTPAPRGEIAIEIVPGLMVRERVTDAV